MGLMDFGVDHVPGLTPCATDVALLTELGDNIKKGQTESLPY